MLHAAGANYYFTNPVTGKKSASTRIPKRDQYKTKADMVAFVKKSFADGAAAIQAKGDKGMSDLVVDPFAHQQVRIYDFAYGFIEHGGEHYGQLVVYYRLAGLVPPESRPRNSAVSLRDCHPCEIEFRRIEAQPQSRTSGIPFKRYR